MNQHMEMIYENLCFQYGVSVVLTDESIIIGVDGVMHFRVNRLYENMTGGELENAIEVGTIIRMRVKHYRQQARERGLLQ